MMQSISLDMDDVHGDGYLSDEEFPPIAGELPPLSPTGSVIVRDPFGDDTPFGNGKDAQVSDGDKENGDKDKRKRRLVNRKPQPKLDAARLCSDRGLPMLSQHFDQIKFKGKGHEISDLNRLMSTMEHWAHRLFPKMPFDEVIERIEKLGRKKPVQTCVKMIRLDIPLLDGSFEDEEQTGQNGSNDDDDDDDDDERDMDTLSRQPSQPSQSQPSQATTSNTSLAMTEEQKERMERSKRLALERRHLTKMDTPAPQGGVTAADIEEIESGGVQLRTDLAMFEVSQRNIWKSSPGKVKVTSGAMFESSHSGGKTTDSATDTPDNTTARKAATTARRATADSTDNTPENTPDSDHQSELQTTERDGNVKLIKRIVDIDDSVEQPEDHKTVEDISDTSTSESGKVKTVLSDKMESASFESAKMESASLESTDTETDVDMEDTALESMATDTVKNGGNTSSDLVLQWDSESADESLVVHGQIEVEPGGDGVSTQDPLD